MSDRTCTYFDPHRTYCCTECGQSIELCSCTDPDSAAHARHTTPEGITINLIRNELEVADPADSLYQLANLTVSLGALIRALVDHDRAGATTSQEVLRAAVRAACAAIRVATHGDRDYSYVFPAVEEELPRGPMSELR